MTTQFELDRGNLLSRFLEVNTFFRRAWSEGVRRSTAPLSEMELKSCGSVAAVDFDLFNGSAAAPEDDAHCVGPAIEGGFDEGSVLS